MGLKGEKPDQSEHCSPVGWRSHVFFGSGERRGDLLVSRRRKPTLHHPGGVEEKAASSHRAEKKLILGGESERVGQGRPALVMLSCGGHRVRT